MNTDAMKVSLTDATHFVEKAANAVASYTDATQRISIRFAVAATAKAECRKALREAMDRLAGAMAELDS